MSFLDPFRSFVSYFLSSLQSQYYYWIFGVLGLLIATLATWGAVLVSNPWFWLVVAILLVVGLVVGYRWWLPKLQERSFLRRPGSEYGVAGQESPQELRAKFLTALQKLKELPQLKGEGDPLYALPWYLLIGDNQSGKTAAIQRTNLFSPLLPVAGGDDTTQNCDWWVSNEAVVLDTAGRYAVSIDMAQDRSEWYWLLRLLRQYRKQSPINGLIVTLSAEALALSPSEEQVRTEASKLRERLEEAVKELGTDFPVYLIITKCDLIEGFQEFFAPLPERVRTEVIGYVDAPPEQSNGTPAPRGTEALHRAQAALQGIYERLHLFRLSLLESRTPASSRPAFFCFPEEFKALCVPDTIKSSRPPLLPFLETLFGEDVRYHTLLLRGIFFTSARQNGALFSLLRRQLSLTNPPAGVEEGNHAYFLSDLFRTIIPRDRYLAHTTERAKKRRRWSRGLGGFTATGAALLLILLLVYGWTVDRQALASVDPSVCQFISDTPQQGSSTPRLDEAEQCRQAVQQLSEHNTQRSSWSSLVFQQSLRLEDELRQRYVEYFRTAVLAPLNVGLDQSFRDSANPLPLVLFIAQRIQLGQRCTGPDGCGESIMNDFQLDYSLWLTPQSAQFSPAQEHKQLQETYEAYLFWESSSFSSDRLKQDVEDDRQRLHRWLSDRQFDPNQFLVEVNKHSSPLTYETYWELPDPFSGASPRIEPACTKGVWQRELAPVFQQLQDAVPNLAAQLRTFHEAYSRRCLGQWQPFLAGFSKGADRWSTRRRDLALQLLTADSPYQRVMRDTETNLTPWLPAQGEGAPPDWVTQLLAYLSSESRQAYQDALTQIDAQIDTIAVPNSCFKVAQDVFAEGGQGENASSPLLQAWQLANQAAPAKSGQQQENGEILGALLREPVQYVWRTILEEAHQHIQKNWKETIVAALQDRPPVERIALLYGVGGKLSPFVDQFVRPFLGEGTTRPTTLLGGKLPFSKNFLGLLRDAELIQTVFGGGSVPDIQIRSTRSPKLTGRYTLYAEEAELSISCATQIYRLNDKQHKPVTIQWSYQGCDEVSITIFVSDQKNSQLGSQPYQFTKRYPGQRGFLYFLQDFLDGSQRFPREQLSSANRQSSGVSAVEVFYSVQGPPTLKKLISALEETALPENL